MGHSQRSPRYAGLGVAGCSPMCSLPDVSLGLVNLYVLFKSRQSQNSLCETMQTFKNILALKINLSVVINSILQWFIFWHLPTTMFYSIFMTHHCLSISPGTLCQSFFPCMLLQMNNVEDRTSFYKTLLILLTIHIASENHNSIFCVILPVHFVYKVLREWKTIISLNIKKKKQSLSVGWRLVKIVKILH